MDVSAVRRRWPITSGRARKSGFVRYEYYVSDGHSEYVARDGRRVISQPAHDQLPVAVDSDRQAFLDHLRRHERGETSYPEMSGAWRTAGSRAGPWIRTR